MSTTAAPAGEYEPPWLFKLREESPEVAARYFDGDSTAVTRFDEMMSMVGNDGLKLDLLRWAYNVRANPNDQMFTGMFIALRIQQASDIEIQKVYETIKATNSEAHGLLADVRKASAIAGGQVDALNETMQTLPVAMKAANESALREASDQLRDIAKNEARLQLSEQAREATAEIDTNLRGTKEHVSKMMDSLKDVRALAHMIGEERQIIFLGFIRSTGRALRACFLGIGVGAVLATLLFGFLVNSTGVGLSAESVRQLREGRTYELMWSSDAASRRFIKTWIAQHP